MDGSEQGTQVILVIGLETTCADDGSIPTEQREIIEIWACAGPRQRGMSNQLVARIDQVLQTHPLQRGLGGYFRGN